MKNNTIYKTDKEELKVGHLYTIDVYATYEVEVKSNGFCGICNFCLSTNEIGRIISELDKMNTSLRGEMVVEDMESDAYIKILFEGRKLIILGQLGGSHENHYMKFEFYADQTILSAFRRALIQY